MLVDGEKFRMGGMGIGGICGNGELGVDVEGNRREADLVATGLVAEFEGDVLRAERSVGLGGEWDAEDDLVLVDIERRFRESKRFELTLGIGDFPGGFEAGGKIEAEVGGNQIFRGRLTGIDVEAGADFQHYGELEGAATGDGLERNISGGRDDFAAGGSLRRLRGGQRGDEDQEKGGDADGGDKFHRRTCRLSC